MREVEVPVVTNAQCQANHTASINDNMICAGGVEGQDSCQVSLLVEVIRTYLKPSRRATLEVL